MAITAFVFMEVIKHSRHRVCIVVYIYGILISHEWSWFGNLYGPGEIWPDILKVSYHETTTQQIDNN